MAGLEPRATLTSFDINEKAVNNGGLIVVGSYIENTSTQLRYLIDKAVVFPVEINVSDILSMINDKSKANQYISDLSSIVDLKISQGVSVVLYTSREFYSDVSLKESSKISEFLSKIVSKLTIRPSFLIAKGGLTSHDIAQKGLKSISARVVGQIEPGIPVWTLDAECNFPELNYVVFPGTVGKDDTLFRIARKLDVDLKNPDHFDIIDLRKSKYLEIVNQFYFNS